MAFISVIIPVYNAESTLNRCITSILKQDFQDYEILLIDDGSSDGSGAICEQFADFDERIRVFHKQNGGVSSARNLGLKNARGKWITFIDADDYIEPDFFPAKIDETDSLVIVNFKTTVSENYTEYLSPKKISGEKNIKHFINENLHLDILRCPWSKFFSYEIITSNHIEFDERFFIGEDTLFVMSYLLFCNIIRISKKGLYRYYKRPSEVSFIKYQLDLNQSIAYLAVFNSLYKRLRCKNKFIVRLLYEFYKGQTIDIHVPEIYRKWLYHPVIVHILWLAYYKDNPYRYLFYLKLWFHSCLLYKIKCGYDNL